MNADFKSGIELVHSEAAGMLEIYVFQPAQIDELLIAALFADASAACLVGLIASTTASICGAPHKEPALCLTCPRPVRGRVAIVLILPHRDDATAGIGSGLCARCAALAPEILSARVQAALREIWPNARTIGRVSEAPEAVQ